MAQSLDQLATLLQAEGAYAKARPHFVRALAIREKALGPDHPHVATSLNNLAALLFAQGAYEEARAPFERALAISERALGPWHSDVATYLSNLAGLHWAAGAYAEARPLIERALAVLENAYGKEHAAVATCLGNLGLLLHTQGSFAEARPLYQRALEVHERALGQAHPEVAHSLNKLAGLLKDEGALAPARPLYLRALAIREHAFGPDHPEVAQSLLNLAALLRAQGELTAAQLHVERALGVFEKALGQDHPDVAWGLNNLALLHGDRGAYADAQLLFERALEIRRVALGEDHPAFATSLRNLAMLLNLRGAHAEARPLFARALALTAAQIRRDSVALSARARLALLRSNRGVLDDWLQFAPKVGLSGYAEVLLHRGALSRCEAAERLLLRRAGADERALVRELEAAQRLTARLANELPPPSRAEARTAWQRRYAEAAAERERLAVELARRVAPHREALERLDLGVADVRAHLPRDGALVDLLRVGNGYLAWVVRADGAPVRVDLGPAAPIQHSCAEFLTALLDDDRPGPGAELRSLVWAPIEARLGAGVRRVFLCPDMALAAIPFAALPGRTAGRYLLDEIAISYLSQPQDLVPRREEARLGQGALLVGDVDYERANVAAEEATGAADESAHVVFDRAPPGRRFRPLPETGPEAAALRVRLGVDTAMLLLGSEATEERVRAGAKGKRILHLATHGFVRADLLRGLTVRDVREEFLSADVERQLALGHDPMLLSGLALAGVNPRAGGATDDGVLTALEASYFDLDGVELVTLSACDTARGTPESGEGVQGFVGALQMAGAKWVVASLWKVDDEATRILMDAFYERLLRHEQPLSPPDALREAARALRDRRESDGTARFAAARFWAPFLAYGR